MEARREPHGAGAAGPRAGPGQPGHHRRPARRQARRLGAGRPALRRHPARGRHPDRVGPRAVRRLPRRPRPAAAAADVQRHRGARPGDGGARRPPRRERSRPTRSAARSARSCGRCRSRSPPRPRRSAGPRRPRPTAPPPGPTPGPRATLVQACSDRRRVRLGYRSEAGSEWVVEVDPWAVVVRHGRWYLLCRSHSADALRAYRIDRVRGVERARRHLRPARRPRPGRRCSRSTSPSAGSTTSRSSSTRPSTPWRAACRAPSDGSSRSTPRPPGWSAAPATRWWYAEQLAAVPAPFRIVRRPRAPGGRPGARPAAAGRWEPARLSREQGRRSSRGYARTTMEENKARRVVDALRDRGTNAQLARVGVYQFGVSIMLATVVRRPGTPTARPRSRRR